MLLQVAAARGAPWHSQPYKGLYSLGTYKKSLRGKKFCTHCIGKAPDEGEGKAILINMV